MLIPDETRGGTKMTKLKNMRIWRSVGGALSLAGALGVAGHAGAESCTNIGLTTVPVGEMLAGLGGGPAGLTVYAHMYNSLSSTNELRVGPDHTIGFLPGGQSFDIAWANAAADTTTSLCLKVTFRARLTAVGPGANCFGNTVGGPWDVDTVLDTCSTRDGVYRGQFETRHQDLGPAAGYLVEAFIFDNNKGGRLVAQDTGCFKVATDPIAICND
jgi:hypothetical protein